MQAYVGENLDLALETADQNQNAVALPRLEKLVPQKQCLGIAAYFSVAPGRAQKEARVGGDENRQQCARGTGAQDGYRVDQGDIRGKPLRPRQVGDHHRQPGEHGTERERLPGQLDVSVRLADNRGDHLHADP